MSQRSFVIDLEKLIMSKGNDPLVKNGSLARPDRF